MALGTKSCLLLSLTSFLVLSNFPEYSLSESSSTTDSKEEIPNPHLNVTLSNDPDDVHFYFFPKLENLGGSVFKEIVYNDPVSLANSGFIANRQTVFIIHGFRSNLNSEMPQTVKNAFLESTLENNIIVLDWGMLATPQPPILTPMLYSLVTRFSVPIVGQRIADFILFLRNENIVTLTQIYLVGHSLGAHLSAIAAGNILKSTGEKVFRVTALDPAGPNFNFYAQLPDRNLMKEDAIFVDVIHTNVGTLGDLTSDGHVDFFPNGGSLQPNCEEIDTASVLTLGRCSHRYAYELYAASLTKSFPACPCPNYRLTHTLGNCSATCNNPVLLGYHSILASPSGDYYLETTNPP